jgi:hypothetical protein
MRVILLGLLLVLSFSSLADVPAWKVDLRERAIRRADAAENAARRTAWIANRRPGQPPPQTNVVEGSYDPTVLAPIELIQQVYPVYNLERKREEKFRREWASRGAAELLGKDWWERLRLILGPAIFEDYENRRMHTLSAEEGGAARESRNAAQESTGEGDCERDGQVLEAARATWGEAFDRFLYQVVAPGVYYWSSSSDPKLMSDPEHWLDEWRWKEEGCK